MADNKKLFMNDVLLVNPTIASQGLTDIPAVQGPIPKEAVFSDTLSFCPNPLVYGNGNGNKAKSTGLPNNGHNSSNKVNDDIIFATLPNILDYYDQYTAHWKLFIVPTSAANSGDVLGKGIQSIIAESGVTDLTIDNVEIKSLATPSIESGTGTMTSLKFEIIEPAGAGLIDQIYYQSLALGIGSWITTPYYLQLQFRGRDPDTEESLVAGGTSGINALNWVWPIKLTNSKIDVTHVGTKYEFDAIYYNDLTQSNSNFSLLNQTSLQGLTDFGSAMADLEKKLNDDSYEKLIDNYSIPDTYRIIVEDKISGVELINPDEKKASSKSGDFLDLSKKTASFPAGTSVDSIVNSILGSTKYFNEQIQGAKTPDANPDTADQEKDQMKKLWRLVTETRPIAFDSLRQDYALDHTIYIFEYDIGVVAADPGQTSASKDAQEKRIKEYLNKKVLRKQYNYFFTGLNDQIKSFDLKMNYSYAAAVSRFGGVYSDGQVQSKGISEKDNAENEKSAGDILRAALTKINNAKPGDNLSSTVNTARQEIANSKVSPTVAARYNNLLTYASSGPVTKKNYIYVLAHNQGLAADGQIGPYDKYGNFIPQKNGTLTSPIAGDTNALKFISDVNISSSDAKDAVTRANALGVGKLRPIPVRETLQEHNFVGTETNTDAGKARTSSMFATAMYSSIDASLQNINLTIKGDPYWLYPRHTSLGNNPLNYKSLYPNQQNAIAEIKHQQEVYDMNSNLYGTDNFIIIRMRTPRIYNDTTGVIDPYTEVETFSGVYKVISITSKFNKGIFTQEINAILDPVINITDIRDFIKRVEENTKKLDPVTPPTITDLNPFAKNDRLSFKNSPIVEPGKDTLGTTPSESMKKAYGTSNDVGKSNIPSTRSSTLNADVIIATSS